jgi:membrane dipeptidase
MNSTLKMGWFDGHNDVSLKLSRSGKQKALDNFTDPKCGHLNAHTAALGGFIGGFFAIFVPSNDKNAPDGVYPEIKFSYALDETLRQFSILKLLDRENHIRICESVNELEKAAKDGIPSAIIHLEGAEVLDSDYPFLDIFYMLGVRSLGPVWSRNNKFGTGVPLKLNTHPDLGPGLTKEGKQLVRDCNKFGVMIDLSHLNEKGFWDVAKISTAPLVATHSNAFSLCPHARNLTDEQLQQIGESKGVVGLTLAEDYLRPHSNLSNPASLDDFINHFDHVLKIVGEEGVAIGSDFDGCEVIAEIPTAAEMPNLRTALLNRGYQESLLEQVFIKNWFRVLERTWKTSP